MPPSIERQMAVVMPVVGFTKTIHNDTYPAIDPTKFNLSGKYVFITGASKGIGRATAISYARAGASGIAILARSDLSSLETELYAAAEKAGRSKPHVLCLKADVTSREQVEASAAKITSEFGRLDILINNAGYLEPWAPTAELNPDDWWKTFEINIKGVFLVNRSLIPLLLKGGDKTIIGVSSLGAIATTPGGSGYQTTKTALIRMTNYLVSEYDDDGLLAYTMHPGGVQTEVGLSMPEAMHAWLNDTAELAADSFVWLTSERREWLNDRFVIVNWNVEELLEKKDEIVEKDLLKFGFKTS